MASFITAIHLPQKAHPSLTIACDGKSALEKVAIDSASIHCNQKHIDFISMISELWNTSKFRITKKHVYGHQDITGRELSMLELLNCKMDIKAKEIACLHKNTTSINIIPTRTSIGFGSIRCGNDLISSKIQQSLYSSVAQRHYYSWLSQKSTFPLSIKNSGIH